MANKGSVEYSGIFPPQSLEERAAYQVWFDVVQRGLKQPPNFHEERLREVAIGHFFDVMTNGFGVMYSYASRIPVEDRWAIAAYVRTLQFSQNADFNQLPEEDQRHFR